MQRRSVKVVMFVLPIVTVLVLTGIDYLADSQRRPAGNGQAGETVGPSLLSQFVLGNQEEVLPTGLVDESGRITRYPPPADVAFKRYPSRQEAQASLDQGDIGSYYAVPASYLETGEVLLYAKNAGAGLARQSTLLFLLASNYLEDPALVSRVMAPALVQEVDLSQAADEGDEDFGGSFLLGIGVGILFYMTVLSGAGYLLQSLYKEKQNRVLEILLSSSRPLELLAGKMIGLGAVGLLHLAIWSLIVVGTMGRRESVFSNLPLPSLAPATWALVLAYFLSGYLVYASLFAGFGAVAPGPKESSQYTFLLMLPIFLPMWFSGLLLSAPNSNLSLAFSLFPLTAPMAMPMRLAVTAVPAWQWAASLALTLLAAAAILTLATRLFRGQTLLSGQALNLRRLWRLLRS